MAGEKGDIGTKWNKQTEVQYVYPWVVLTYNLDLFSWKWTVTKIMNHKKLVSKQMEGKHVATAQWLTNNRVNSGVVQLQGFPMWRTIFLLDEGDIMIG